MKKESVNKLLVVTLFAIAMAFLETVIVVYLRRMFYPEGFSFPLKGFFAPEIFAIEWVREIATIIMLLALGYLAGKKFYERFAYFIYAFAIWDIFYYVFLKVIINWPSTLLDWDALFLIPWVWVGPVIAPVICSILLIVMAFLIINFQDKGKKITISSREWTFLIAGMALALYTWLYDYGKVIFQHLDVATYVPQNYNWTIFIIGIILTSIGIASFRRRMLSKK